MANGNGVATDLQGPLAQMWRDVYRKAAQAAEARLAQLLAEHVYHLHGRRALTIVVEGAPEAAGGTGNTTMTTQTTAPTGAENSLWFNPSETA